MQSSPSHYRIFFKAALLVGIPVILSRMLGLIREQYSLYLFGASWELDAYISAYKIPTVLRNLLGEGAFSVVFISIFSVLWPKNKKAAQRFSNQVLSYLFVSSLVISLIAYIFTPSYMSIIHRSSENFALTVHLSRIMVFFINFISLAGILTGVLNSQSKYLVPALAPAAANIVNILLIYFGHEHFGIDILAIGYLGNAIIIFILQIPFVLRTGLGFHFDFTFSPRLKFFLKSFFPVAFGMAFFQINQLLTNMFSSQIEGGNSVMDKSFLVIQMAIAVLSAGISTALLPAISRTKEKAMRNQIYTEGMKTTFIVVFPSVILFIAFGQEISSFIYKDLILLVAGDLGKIDIYAIERIGGILILFAPGILVYSLVTMVTRAFQGMNLYIYPLLGSLISTCINIVLMYSFFPIWGLIVLPISLIFASIIDLLLLLFLLYKKTGQSFAKLDTLIFVFKNFFSGILMYVCIMFLFPYFHFSNLLALPLGLFLGFIIHYIFLFIFREEITVRFYRAIFSKK